MKVGRAERLGPVTTDKIREWVGDSTVRIQPVIRMDGDDAVNGHDPPDRMREQVILRDPTCRFPGCQVDSRRCDLDHVIPYDPSGPPGQTRPSQPRPAEAVARIGGRSRQRGGWIQSGRRPPGQAGAALELEQVVDGADQAPLAVHGWESAAG